VPEYSLAIFFLFDNGHDYIDESTNPSCSGSAPAAGLRLVDDLGREHPDPAVVLVSNNPYAVGQPLMAGTRPSLSGGMLGVLLVDAPAGKAGPPARAWSARRVAVSSTEPVHAGVDGEAVKLNPPLRFAIRPAALRVRIARHHPGVSPSGLAA